MMYNFSSKLINIVKQNIFFPYLLLLILLSQGCFYSKEVVLLKEFDGNGVAVLNFATQGKFIENSIGKNAADRLTDALFLKKNIRVIDRTKVNDLLIDMEIKSNEALSNEQLALIGKKLNANFLILGRIIQTSSKDVMVIDSKYGLYVSFRIISVATSDVVGMASYETIYSNDLFKEVDKAVLKITQDMEL